MILKLEDYWNTKTEIECIKDEFYQLVPLLNKMRKNLNITRGGAWFDSQWANTEGNKVGIVNMMSHTIGYLNHPHNQVVQASLFLIPTYEIVDNYEIY